jgi:hypothetical protein
MRHYVAVDVPAFGLAIAHPRIQNEHDGCPIQNGRKTTLDYVRMLYISYGSVCELETQILLAGDLDLIEKSELGPLKKDIAEIERMLKALIKSLENKPLNP